jgi:hypothetical protein
MPHGIGVHSQSSRQLTRRLYPQATYVLQLPLQRIADSFLLSAEVSKVTKTATYEMCCTTDPESDARTSSLSKSNPESGFDGMEQKVDWEGRLRPDDQERPAR